MHTHRHQVLARLGLPQDTSLSLKELSTLTKVPLKALQEVYNRGLGAWGSNISSVRLAKNYTKNPDTKTYPRSARLTAPQWAYARVYSFLNGGTTFKTADADIARKYGIVAKDF